MKKNILLFILSCWSVSIVAQITVTNATFPEVGDTLRTAIDTDPDISLLDAGENLTWDFSSLVGPVFEEVILDPSEGNAAGDYPDATFLEGQPPISETYYKTTSTEYVSLGFSGADPIGIGLDVIFKNSPPLVERVSPLNYNDQGDYTSSVFVPFAWSDLPTAIIDSIGGGFPITPDSIAIEVSTERIEDTDAWGTVQLPIGNFEVLRVRRWDLTDTKVKAYLPFLQWTDVTAALAGTSPFLGLDTTLTYRFYNDVQKEPIAVVTADPMTEEPTRVRFKANESTTSIIKLHQKKPNIYAYPNPAIDKVRFDVVNLPKGKYDLKIYNILGVEVWRQQYDFYNPTDTIQLNLGNFKKGTYLYSLVNEKGKTLATRRLIILRP